MALSFRRNGDNLGSFGVTLPMHDRSILVGVVPQIRELVNSVDAIPFTWRLFPNPYPNHHRAAAEYAELIGDDLRIKHLAALDTVSETLDAKRLDEDQMVAWMHAVNHLRLFMGTRLDVSEETEVEDFDTEQDQALRDVQLPRPGARTDRTRLGAPTTQEPR